MGITCKPMKKMKSIMKRLDNQLAKEAALEKSKLRKNDNDVKRNKN